MFSINIIRKQSKQFGRHYYTSYSCDITRNNDTLNLRCITFPKNHFNTYKSCARYAKLHKMSIYIDMDSDADTELIPLNGIVQIRVGYEIFWDDANVTYTSRFWAKLVFTLQDEKTVVMTGPIISCPISVNGLFKTLADEYDLVSRYTSPQNLFDSVDPFSSDCDSSDTDDE